MPCILGLCRRPSITPRPVTFSEHVTDSTGILFVIRPPGVPSIGYIADTASNGNAVTYRTSDRIHSVMRRRAEHSSANSTGSEHFILRPSYSAGRSISHHRDRRRERPGVDASRYGARTRYGGNRLSDHPNKTSRRWPSHIGLVNVGTAEWVVRRPTALSPRFIHEVRSPVTTGTASRRAGERRAINASTGYPVGFSRSCTEHVGRTVTNRSVLVIFRHSVDASVVDRIPGRIKRPMA